MALKTRIASGILAATVAISMTACGGSDTSWAVKTDNYSISSGEFIAYTMMATSLAERQVDLGAYESVLGKQIGDTDADEWIDEEALRQAKMYIGVLEKFDELGLEYTTELQDQVDMSVDMYYPQFVQYYYYDQLGVGESSYHGIIEANIKYDQVFNSIYGEGGSEEVSTDDIRAYFDEHVSKYKIWRFLKVDINTGKDLSEEEINQAKSDAEDYLEQINSGATTFDDAYVAYMTEQGSTNATAPSYTYSFDVDEMTDIQRKAIFEDAQPDGDATIYENNVGYFIVSRASTTDDDFSDYQATALRRMKSDEFEEMLVETAENAGLQVNNSTLGKYNVNSVEKKRRSVEAKAMKEATNASAS